MNSSHTAFDHALALHARKLREAPMVLRSWRLTGSRAGAPLCGVVLHQLGDRGAVERIRKSIALIPPAEPCRTSRSRWMAWPPRSRGQRVA
jgi:hypothetical protein